MSMNLLRIIVLLLAFSTQLCADGKKIVITKAIVLNDKEVAVDYVVKLYTTKLDSFGIEVPDTIVVDAGQEVVKVKEIDKLAEKLQKKEKKEKVKGKSYYAEIKVIEGEKLNSIFIDIYTKDGELVKSVLKEYSKVDDIEFIKGKIKKMIDSYEAAYNAVDGLVGTEIDYPEVEEK